jgi:hypothetical protein
MCFLDFLRGSTAIQPLEASSQGACSGSIIAATEESLEGP